MSKIKVLVTGGTGYIGSHTTVELINEGFDVVIADDLSNSKLGALEGIRQITGVKPCFEQIDLCDKGRFEDLLRKHKDIAAVIHFAAYKAVGESVAQPLKYYRNNLVSLINLLELMERYSVENLVFSSSCTVYGQPQKLPVTEQSPIQAATSPYGNTKQISEEIIQDAISAAKKIKSIALRYFNPVGAHPSALIGELPVGVPNNLVPFITQAAIGIRQQLSVFGNDYNTPDGSCIRDYIHVVDLAKGHLKALDKAFIAEGINVYNLGTGTGYSVLDLVKAFEIASGKTIPYKFVERRPGDIAECFADPKKAYDELKWKAELGIDKMCEDSWRWQKNNPEGYN